MTDTKDAAQILRDAGWLVVEPDGWYEGPWGHICVEPDAIYRTPETPEETPDTIDWSHVDPKYRYMARDEDGEVMLYTHKPKTEKGNLAGKWEPVENGETDHTLNIADHMASFRRGTVPWDKSLVCREGEG